MSEELRLRPGTRLLWRGGDTAQLELGAHAVVVEGLGPAAAALLRSAGAGAALDPAGAALVPSGVAAAAGAGAAAAGDGDGEDISDLVEQLRRAGFLSRTASAQTVPAANVPGRLAPDLLAWSARAGDEAGAVAAARRHGVLVVHGEGRLPVMIATLLAAAGVGWVHLAAAGEVSVLDAAPGGFLPSDEGRRVAGAGADAVHRVAPETRTAAPTRRPQLVVVVSTEPVERDLHRFLHRERLPHLVVGVWADTATVGPLVVPGRTSCLRCADLHRAERDPAWPALALQLHAGTRRRPRPEDVTVCALAAAVTTAQALAWLEHQARPTTAPVPATVDGTLELGAPGHRIRRRSWPRRAECGCATDETMAG